MSFRFPKDVFECIRDFLGFFCDPSRLFSSSFPLLTTLYECIDMNIDEYIYIYW